MSDTGATSADPSAILDLKSASKGFLPPKMTTAQRDAISSPATGLIIYNTDSNTFDYFNGTEWGQLGSGGCEPPAQPGSITGSSIVCSGATGESFSISAVPDALTYTWQVPAGASITSGQGTTSIVITFGSTSGDVSVRAENDCGNSSYTDLAVTVNSLPAQPGSITGSASVCTGASGVSYSITSVSGASSYNWTVPSGASIVSGQGTTSISVDFGTSSGNVSVRAQNSCGNSAYRDLAISVSNGPTQPASITGSTSVCSGATGESYSITSVAGATSYNWTVPSGATIQSGQGTTSITIDFGSTSGNVSVRAENNCGNSSYTDLAVTVSAGVVQPGPITGADTVCNNTTGESYSISPVSGATGYNWTVPADATIQSGQGTTSITVDFGTTSGNVSVRAESSCGNSPYTDLAVSVGIAIGCDYAGGIVFYIDGVNGYVCTDYDETAAEWGCWNSAITGASAQGMGMGAPNTALIVASCSQTGIAARVCDDLVYNGYSDWFLPSHDEMDALANALDPLGIGNLSNGTRYWTSSQYGGNESKQAWTLLMQQAMGYFKQPENKNDPFIFRCARAY
jgi:hypothetical protein